MTGLQILAWLDQLGISYTPWQRRAILDLMANYEQTLADKLAAQSKEAVQTQQASKPIHANITADRLGIAED